MYENSQKIYAMETDPSRIAVLNSIKTKQDKIYDIEENSIEAIQQKIDKLVDANKVLQIGIDKEIANLKALGKTRDEWDIINARLDYYSAVMTAKESSAELGGLLSAAESLNLTWKDILTKMAEYTKGIPKAITAAKDLIIPQGSSSTSQQNSYPVGTGNNNSNNYVAPTQVEENMDVPVTKSLVEILKANAKATADSAAVYKEQATINPINSAKLRMMERLGLASGGIVPKYFASGGYTRGTDTIPAMLTPGEFVMSKYAVQTHGIDNMKSINSGSSTGDSVYNYNLNLNVKSDANPDDIARAVMVQIKSVDAQRIRGARL
jgi:hypothetical protein